MEIAITPAVCPLFRSLSSSPRAIKLRRARVYSSPGSLCQQAQVMQQWNLRDRKLEEAEISAIIGSCRCYIIPDFAQKVLYEMKTQGIQPEVATLSALLLCYLESGLIDEAEALWGEIMNSAIVPSIRVVSCLVDTYVRTRRFEDFMRILDEAASKDLSFASQLYSAAVTCFGSAGQLEKMESVVKNMVSRGFKVDSVTGNNFLKYYSMYGTLLEMEAAYESLKKSRILIEKEAIKAMALAYISHMKFYDLGEFLKDVGLRRRNTGNLLWNLLLLSFAANFKMKSLQREFLAMIEAGFSPDITTFNIRALAFSRMGLFWDLHLSVEHMAFKGVVPDLVTYGCVVDAYLGRRLGRNLSFVLDKMNVDNSPVILTDPLVFEAFGKGDFHSSSESLLEARSQRKWTYSKLIAIYLRKQYRSNQLFWNY
ncbi:pentatricopeptide repeat-containing protein At3g42630 [Phalaenopsis equestris]|uniref:pentatricopeptide repeat-containing protein At3g42630 n=1 Tax=Phalaenopsis equestris TaxID=78828 RepID=UPI0009E31AD8|nr:pentatricopeptide repeat-containing protein At3g42630 [Phalaenopsis equestris]